MGRSRGGLTTKIHALVDTNSNPIPLKLTPGQAHDGRSAADMMGGLGAGQVPLADRAYDCDALLSALAAQRAWANVKPLPRRVNIPAFSALLYRYCYLVERFFSKLLASVRKDDELEESDVILCRAPDWRWRVLRCGQRRTGASTSARSCAIPAI